MTAPEPTEGPLTFEELQLATRNRGMPLEALRYDITPTGLHYLLVHFDIPEIDQSAWRLSIGGNVERQLELSLDEVRARPAETAVVTMECSGNGRARMMPRPVSQPWLVEAIGTAEWTGAPLWPLLEEAGVREDTVDLVFTGADRGIQGDEEQDYARSLTPAQAREMDVLLAYEMNGSPLQPQHGFPLRLLVPGWYGMASVKWLTRIDAVINPFTGYQQRVSYNYRRDAEDPGQPVTSMHVRALMIPPGIPDFFTRHRLVDRGLISLSGRAWSGFAPVVRVEVGVDGTWHEAKLSEMRLGPYAWLGWTYEWNAKPGEHELSCRATDASGEIQPLEAPWNRLGFGNNLVQLVGVTVR